jgi:hypothetical protein
MEFFLTCDFLIHNILLFKLEAYGTRVIVNQWFKSYLSLRKLR